MRYSKLLFAFTGLQLLAVSASAEDIVKVLINSQSYSCTADVPPPPPLPVVSGCTESSYVAVDGTAVTVTIAPTGGYSPKCLKVKAGTTVTIKANSTHPLQGQADVASVLNPIRANAALTVDTTVTLNEPGVYGYFCTRHGTAAGTGMAGAILVVP